MENLSVRILHQTKNMKALLCLTCFIFGFGVMAQAQKKKSEAPKVNPENFAPPSKSTPQANRQTKKVTRQDIPKVDLTNFKPPVNGNSKTKKD